MNSPTKRCYESKYCYGLCITLALRSLLEWIIQQHDVRGVNGWVLHSYATIPSPVEGHGPNMVHLINFGFIVLFLETYVIFLFIVKVSCVIMKGVH